MLSVLHLWVVAQSSTSPDASSLVTWLGPFAAAAAVGVWFVRDAVAVRNRAIAAVEAQTPVLVEIRDTMRTAVRVIESNTDAMGSAAEALKRCPSEEHITRLRVALEQIEARGSNPPRGRTG